MRELATSMCARAAVAAKFFTGIPLDGPDPECVLGHGEEAMDSVARAAVSKVTAAPPSCSAVNPSAEAPPKADRHRFDPSRRLTS